MSNKVKIAISCGDLNGIGLETLAKVFSDKRMFKFCIPILYASDEVFVIHKKTLKDKKVHTSVISNIDQAKENTLNIFKCWEDEVQISFGSPDKSLAKYTINSLERATQDTLDKKVDAIVTLPINKEVIQTEEFKYRGHTNYLRDKDNAEDSLMFLVSDIMRVGVVTGHVPVSDIAKNITQSAILQKTQLMNNSLINDFGINKPKIAVLGLNPHAGDNGTIGTDEMRIIVPAIEKLNNDGIIAVGPYPSDGFFGLGMYKNYDGILAMYHDQGLVPFKMMSFHDGVNFTAGLSFVRTSPDHGTAYSIAGKGIANEESLRNSIFKAIEILETRTF